MLKILALKPYQVSYHIYMTRSTCTKVQCKASEN